MIAAALVIEFLEDKVAGHFSKFGQVDSVATSGSYSHTDALGHLSS